MKVTFSKRVLMYKDQSNSTNRVSRRVLTEYYIHALCLHKCLVILILFFSENFVYLLTNKFLFGVRTNLRSFNKCY